VFAEVHRVVRPAAPFVCTFSNRCFPTKAVHGWLATGDDGHCAIVAEYFARSASWAGVQVERRVAGGHGRDPLYAVWGTRA
jgi:hypothetical protein